MKEFSSSQDVHIIIIIIIITKFINRTVSIILNQRRVGEWQAKMAIVTTT